MKRHRFGSRAIQIGAACFVLGLMGPFVSWGQTFSVSATPSALTIHPGDQNVPLTVSVSSSTYTGPVVVTLTGLPSGITLTPLTLTPGNSGTINLTASSSADAEGFAAAVNVVGGANTAESEITVVGAVGSTVATTAVALTVSLTNPAYAPPTSSINLPVVSINTGGVPVTSKTIDVPGTITITSADGQTSYLPNSSDSDNTATFHVHGSSTASMPKLPYHISLNASLDLLHAMGVDCPYVKESSGNPTCDKSKSYILLANYDDKTLLRDWSAFALANSIPIGNGYLGEPADSPTPSGTAALMPWASHSLFVELYLNGIYEGNYQLTEEVKVDSHKVNLSELAADSTDITGGYLLEIDHHEDEEYVFFTPQGLPIGLTAPDIDPPVAAQLSYISNYVDAAETALFSSQYTDPTLGWRAYYDEASAINFYIVNDLMGNVDGGAFYSSDYLYKNVDNPLLYMGPVWDFDISAGNVRYQPISNPIAPWMQQQALWYKQWFTDPGFQADVTAQWNALKNNGVFANWLAAINQEAATLQQSQANNFGRWPMQGIRVWPNTIAFGSYGGEVNYLTDWISLRLGYLDSLFNAKAQTEITVSGPTEAVRANATITLSAQVSGGNSPTGTVTFQADQVVIGSAPLSSNGSAALVLNGLPASITVGEYNLNAAYNGDQNNALSYSNTSTVNVLAPLIPSVISLASSVSSANNGTAVEFTMAVFGDSGTASPTGTFSLTVNGSSLGTVNVSAGGTATLSTAGLPIGTDNIVATYSGDSNYQASTSNAFTVTIIAVPSFSLSLSPPETEIDAGQSAMFNVSVTPVYGFNQAVNFACSGLPAGGSCSFSPATVTPGSSPATTTMTITTVAGEAAAASRHSSAFWTKFSGGVVLALLLWPARRARRWPIAMVLGLLIGSLALSGCGSSRLVPPQTYTVTVTGTGGGVTQTSEVILTVQN